MEEKAGKKGFTEVSIPVSLFKKIEERIRGTEFSSVSDYVTYVLRELLSGEEEEEALSEEDEEKIKARLRALGYID
ncbi:MAG TPA: CopG family transcriptional regulator [Candidatus Bathyarchaeota archaeon]|nr:CopG family transcriptional regulator [Candidatus Bathyarchaeota archaeon]